MKSVKNNGNGIKYVFLSKFNRKRQRKKETKKERKRKIFAKKKKRFKKFFDLAKAHKSYVKLHR